MPLMPGMSVANYPPALAISLFYRAVLAVAIALGMILLLARPWLKRNLSAEAEADPFAQAAVRNSLAYWLGGLWTLDGLLQLQPQMATRFIGRFLAPLLQGQPGWVRTIIEAGMHVWQLSPVWFNVGAVLVQLLIGLTLLFSREGAPLRRAALYVSIGWGMVVWACGEAFGSLFSGGGPFVGSPGSVLLYVAAAVLLLLPARLWAEKRLWRGFAYGMAAFFFLMAFLAAWPPNGWWGSAAASWMYNMAHMPQPSVLAGPLAAFAQSYQAHPVGWNAAVVLSAVILGVLWAVRPRGAVVWFTIAWTLFVWYLGQDFGVFGGMGTDPNTGGILLLYALLWRRHLRGTGPVPATQESGGGAMRHSS
jgi:hypothetical protein